MPGNCNFHFYSFAVKKLFIRLFTVTSRPNTDPRANHAPPGLEGVGAGEIGKWVRKVYFREKEIWVMFMLKLKIKDHLIKYEN